VGLLMPKTMICLPVVLSALASLSLGAEPSGSCKTVGAIFSIDPFGEMLLLKNSRGYFENVTLPPNVAIAGLPVTPAGSITRIRPADLNAGDLVCVHGGGNGPVQLSVASRADVHRAQAAFIAEWYRNSVFGMVKSADVAGRKLVVAPLAPSTVDDTPVQVSVPESVLLRAALPDARRMGESTTFHLEDLRPGEPVYVRGVRSADRSHIAASVILKGGYRAILGALIEVKVADSVLRINEFGTGRMLSMKMTPGQVYRTTENLTDPMKVRAATGAVLTPVGLADLQTGDAILIVGTSADGKSEGVGLFAVTRFGTFGVLPQDSGDRISWLIGK
jgi:hypothetical protein